MHITKLGIEDISSRTYQSIDDIINILELNKRFKSFKLVSIHDNIVNISVTGKDIFFKFNNDYSEVESETINHNNWRVNKNYNYIKLLKHTLIYTRIFDDVSHVVFTNLNSIIYATFDKSYNCVLQAYYSTSINDIRSILIKNIDANTTKLNTTKVVNFRVSEVTLSSVRLNWECSDKSMLSILRNGKEIGTSHNGIFVDRLLCPNTEYLYELKGLVKLATLHVTTEVTPQIQTIAVGDDQPIDIKVGIKNYKFECNIEFSDTNTRFSNPLIFHTFNDVGLKTIQFGPAQSIKYITELDISNCNVINLDNQFLLNMSNSLKVLDISGNKDLIFNLKQLEPLTELTYMNLSGINSTGAFTKLPTKLNTIILNNTSIKSANNFDFTKLTNIKLIELENNSLSLDQLHTIIQVIYNNRFNFIESFPTLNIQFNSTIPLNSETFKLLFYLTINPHKEDFNTWNILADIEELTINVSELKLHDGNINQYMDFILKPNLTTSDADRATFTFKYNTDADGNNVISLKPETLRYAVDSVNLSECCIYGNITKICSYFPKVSGIFKCNDNKLANGDIELLPKDASEYDFSNTNVCGNIEHLSKSAKLLKFDNTKLIGNIRDIWDAGVIWLSLHNCINVTGNIDLLPKTITHLNLSFCDIEGGINSEFTSFQDVNLEHTNVTFDLTIVSENIELTVLNLNDCKYVTGTLEDLKTSKQLKVLRLKDSSITGNLKDLPPNLIEVDLRGCDVILDDIFHLTKLTSLKITGLNTKPEQLQMFLNNILCFIHNFDPDLVIEIELNDSEEFFQLIADINKKITINF